METKLKHEITFARLSEIEPSEIIAHMSDPRVAEHMPLLTFDWDEAAVAKFVTAKEECWKRDGLGHWAIMLKAQFTNCMRSLSTIWSEASDFSRKNIQTCAEGAQDPLNPLTLVGGGSVYVPFEIKGKDHHGSQAISGMAVQDRPTRPGAAATGRSRAFGGTGGICFPGCDRRQCG